MINLTGFTVQSQLTAAEPLLMCPNKIMNINIIMIIATDFKATYPKEEVEDKEQVF